jgi:ketosteroid isomerase-like protein
VIRISALIIAIGVGWCGALLAGRVSPPQDTSERSRVIEIRVYTLKPGTRQSFHDLFVRESLPLLRRRSVDVIAYGPSLHDALSYYLVRSFGSLDDRMRSEDAFYGSKEWLEGPRDRVLAAIETYSTVVVNVGPESLRAMRQLVPEDTTQANKKGFAMEHSTLAATASDVTTLLALNEDYIRSVESSDVQRFRRMLADDFMCSLPDGTHIDRDAFLKHVAEPAGIHGLQAHDVNVRVMGDFALIHARTTFTRDGRPGASRYTDAWARRHGRWVAVAAHVTRY